MNNTLFFIDQTGRYIGGFSEGNHAIPDGAVEVPFPPSHAACKWVNGEWQEADPVRTVESEIQWRNETLRMVVDSLDQIRNDKDFGSTTYSKPYTAEQLNSFRVLLCDYPDQPDFPNGQRPILG